jgi:alpha-ribazole phosphatase
MEIYLIRHTAVHNPEKLCYGQSDIPLAQDWELAFNSLKSKLGEFIDDPVFYSSPFKRCTRLAEFLSDNKYLVDERISEMHFGNWEQCPWTALDQTELNRWMADYVNYPAPEGESFQNLYERCAQFWDELLLQDQPKIFIITHGGVVRSILAYILNVPLNKVFQLEIVYSAITKITVSKQHGLHQRIDYINR